MDVSPICIYKIRLSGALFLEMFRRLGSQLRASISERKFGILALSDAFPFSRHPYLLDMRAPIRDMLDIPVIT